MPKKIAEAVPASKKTKPILKAPATKKPVDPNTIYFYSAKNQHGFLSNFYESPFTLDGKKFKTNEHYFQSRKFVSHPEEELKVIQCATPAQAFKLGRNKAFHRRADWEAVKEDVMYTGLKQKFSSPELKAQLIATGSKQIVEHTWKDKYWADGNGSGLNRLGVLLMRLRNDLSL